MPINDKAKRYLLAAWVAAAASYILLVLPRLGYPILGWEALVWDVPRNIAQTGYASVRFFYLPPLYDSLIAFCFRIFGLSEASARLPGIISFLVMPAVIYFIVKELSDKKDVVPVTFLAGAIYMTAPLVIQGSLVIDRTDTTILTLLLTLFYLAIFRTEDRPLWYRAGVAGSVYAVCLWAKLTTPLACLVAVPMGYLVCGRPKDAIKIPAAIFGAGFVLFLITWALFIYLAAGIERFSEPIAYYAASAAGAFFSAPGSFIKKVILDLFRCYLWFSPFLLIPVGLAILDAVRTTSVKKEIRLKLVQAASFLVVISAGYLYSNATFSGFPKYPAPAVPLAAVLAARFLWRESRGLMDGRRLKPVILVLLAGIVYYSIFVKDWIYGSFLLRTAQLAGSLKEAVHSVIKQQSLYLLFPVACFFLSTRLLRSSAAKKMSVILAVSLIASNIAMDLLQRSAPYSVNFAYGTTGARELKDFILLRKPADIYSSVEGFMANVGDARFYDIKADIWNDPHKLLGLLAGRSPECLIYGPAANTIAQLNGTMKNDSIEEYIGRYYKVMTIGDYTIALRK